MASSSSRGLRLLKAIENYTKKKPNQLDTSSVFKQVKLLSASDGHVRGSFKVENKMCNMMDILHGGYISTIVDTLSTFGQMSHDKGKLSWTTNMNIVYLNAAFLGDEISIDVTPIVVGRATFVEVTLRNDSKSGVIIAKGTVSFVHGSDKHQLGAKEIFGLDLNEN